MNSQTSDETPKIVLFAPNSTRLLLGDTNGPIGGAELQLSILASELPAYAQTSVITDVPLGDDRKFAFHWVPLFNKIPNPRGRIVTFSRYAWAVIRAVRQFRGAVVVQRCSGITTLIVALACRLSGNYFIYNWAGECDIRGDHIAPRPIGGFLYRVGRWLAHGQIVQTHEQERWAKGPNIIRVPNMIDNTLPWGRANGNDVLWVGTIKSQFKQAELVIDLAEKLPHRNFVVVGRFGSDEEFNLRFQNAVRNRPNISLLGHVARERLADVYTRGRCLVNTSSSEGFSNTFLEAVASGVPIVSLNHDPDELLTAGGVGVNAHGSLEKLAEAIESMFEGDSWNLYSSRCPTVVRRYSPTEVARRFSVACSTMYSD